VGVAVAVAVPVGGGVPVTVGVEEPVAVPVWVTVGVGGVAVGVAGRVSGSVMVWVSSMTLPSAMRTRARTVTVLPCRLCVYLMHDSAAPGCGTTCKVPVLHGAAALVKPGLVTASPETGLIRLNVTGTSSSTVTPLLVVTTAPSTLVKVPSPLSLR